MAEVQTQNDDPTPTQPPSTPGADDQAQQQGDNAQPDTPLADQSWEAARLAAARSEAEAEAEAEAGHEPGDAPPPEAEPEPQPAAAPEPEPEPEPEPTQGVGEDKGKDDVPMIPKPRFDEAVKKATDETQKAREEAAFLKGQLSALKDVQRDGTPGQPGAPEKTPDEIIAEAKAEKQEKAQLYDDGKMSTAEWERVRDDLDERISEARFAKIETANKPSDAATKGDDLFLDELTAKLEKEHPFTHLITEGEKWQQLSDIAIAEMKAEGVAVMPGARGEYQLRERIARLTDTWGPRWTGLTADQARQQLGLSPAPAPKPEGQQKPTQPQPDTKPSLSKQAQERVDKLALQDRHPPDINDAGTPTEGGVDNITEEDIEKMTVDEISALPKAVRRKFLPLND